MKQPRTPPASTKPAGAAITTDPLSEVLEPDDGSPRPARSAPAQVPVRRGRPPKVLSLVPQRTLAQRAEAAARYHQHARCAAVQAVEYAIMCGLELLAAREVCGHGDWLPWLREHAPVPERTAQRYMELSERLMPRLEPVTAALAERLDAGPGAMLEDDVDRLAARIRTATDGATLTQLYLEMGILQAPEQSERARGAGKTRAARSAALPPGETLAHYTAAADWAEITDLLHHFTESGSHAHLHLPELQAAYNYLRDTGAKFKAIIAKG